MNQRLVLDRLREHGEATRPRIAADQAAPDAGHVVGVDEPNRCRSASALVRTVSESVERAVSSAGSATDRRSGARRAPSTVD